MAYRTRNRTILAKVETTPGIDASPAVGTDAVLVESPNWSGGIEALATNEVTGSLDPRAPVPGGGGGNWTGTVNLRGSGTGGTAPEWGVFMQGASFAQSLLAADVTGTATAGATGSITLEAGDGALVDIGQIITTTGGAGSGQTRVITAIVTDTVSVFPDWTTTPDATTVYAVKASALYVPASQDIKNLTIYDYLHQNDSSANSKLRKVLGAMGNVQLTLPARGLVRAAFTFQGKFTKPTDVAHPGAATFDTQRPIAFQSADISLGGTETKFNTMTVDVGAQVALADDPSDTFGVDVADVTVRGTTGRINPPVALTSVRDVWTDFLDGTGRKLWVRYGSAGNGLSFYFPDIRYTGSEEEDINGLAHEGIPFGAQGEDTGVYINVY